MSKNAEGWIRHRGGKCPVDVGDIIDVRHRSGEVISGAEMDGSGWYWDHHGNPFDIMAYRLHKPAERVAPNKVGELTIEVTANTEGAREVIEGVQMQIDQIDGPIKWRDRITEIDATTKALTTERADLVQKLASEGFALIERINDLLTEAAQKHEDMGDPNNWKHGDVLYCTSSDTTGKQFIEGSLYVFESYTDGCSVRVEQDSTGKPNGMMPFALRWHSRPSA